MHNTLTVNNTLQRVEGKATITGHSAAPAFMNATTNLTELYTGGLVSANRGVAIVDKAWVLVRDEVETPAAETTVRWTMLTPASVNLLGGHRAELVKDGKKLILTVDEPARVVLKTWSTDPTHDYDAPNPGTTLVGFEVTLPANTKAALTVRLVPEKEVGNVLKQNVQPLSEWPH